MVCHEGKNVSLQIHTNEQWCSSSCRRCSSSCRRCSSSSSSRMCARAMQGACACPCKQTCHASVLGMAQQLVLLGFTQKHHLQTVMSSSIARELHFNKLVRQEYGVHTSSFCRIGTREHGWTVLRMVQHKDFCLGVVSNQLVLAVVVGVAGSVCVEWNAGCCYRNLANQVSGAACTNVVCSRWSLSGGILVGLGLDPFFRFSCYQCNLCRLWYSANDCRAVRVSVFGPGRGARVPPVTERW
jgi:hypothetical protein